MAEGDIEPSLKGRVSPSIILQTSRSPAVSLSELPDVSVKSAPSPPRIHSRFSFEIKTLASFVSQKSGRERERERDTRE